MLLPHMRHSAEHAHQEKLLRITINHRHNSIQYYKASDRHKQPTISTVPTEFFSSNIHFKSQMNSNLVTDNSIENKGFCLTPRT